MRRFIVEVPFVLVELPSEENPNPSKAERSGSFSIELEAETPEKAIELANVYMIATGRVREERK